MAKPVIFVDFSAPYATFADGVRNPRVGRAAALGAAEQERDVGNLALSLVVIDLRDLTVSDLSWRALRDLNATPGAVIGQPASSALPGEGTAHALEAMRHGAIDFYRGRRIWMRAFTVGDRPIAVAETSVSGAAGHTALTGYLGRDPATMVYGTTTTDWVLCSLSDDLKRLLGGNPAEYIGHNLLHTLGEDNAHTLLQASRQVGRNKSVSVPLQVHDTSGVTQPLRFAVTLLAGSNELSFLLVRAEDVPTLTPQAFAGLTSRQLDVLSRLMRGERVPTIADGLFISQSTVRNHLTAIFEHFGVHTQAELLKILGGAGS